MIFRRPTVTVAYLFLAFFIAGCGYEANEGTTDNAIAEAADTISPAADETDGMDNVKGYHTVQLSTTYVDYMPFPPAVIEGDHTTAVYYPGEAAFDFAPDRYVFRYLIPKSDDAREMLNRNPKKPPLFDLSCRQATVPIECSNAKYLNYLKEESGDLSGSEVAYAYITLSESGELERIDQIVPANEATCEGCRAKVQRMLRNMPKWAPAHYNGEAVKSQIILPVRI